MADLMVLFPLACGPWSYAVDRTSAETDQPNCFSSRILGKLPTAESQCQTREELPIHIIYIDIVGLTQFKRRVKAGYGKFSCLLRIVDSFGTEPAFNFEPYAKSRRLKTQWGMQNLNPQQFFTMFPHSPDNSFMGFVVEEHLNESESLTMMEKKDQAVVYGKAEYMWQGKEDYLAIIHKRLEVHGTVFTDPGGAHMSVVPQYIHNHGILSGPDLHRLLRQSKLFIGLGFPYEGPAPLEAIAHGCVFINPKFSPPHSSQNTKFFKGKPTMRKVTSQHPYVEEFVGEPHVYTVDIGDKDTLEQVIIHALNDINLNKVRPYMPYEFTKEGMLQRLNAYIEHQDFCTASLPQWPPTESVIVIAGELGKSCKDTCRQRDLICEPSYFKVINNRVTIEKHIGQLCADVVEGEDIYFPAFIPASQKCIIQRQLMLFSCVGEVADLSRLCPCRDYIPGQTALCKHCL
ncbi:hypothetical protein LSH36_564g01050 [Paralvinella palmiformis]|uniref:alpha-1,6-mannosyl-glycoprotein 6-beta-N-acetylglucosaminyltransferase n=1 Tax=Paralvinella palmiformis TaxID=53620 RepID=A0AAD9J7P4_9ANNE|nr:hypothetical protein LSH36_564g01050 [Paralvinella palmiformis]